MVHRVVNYEEAVVVAVALPNIYGRVLPIVAFEVEGQRLGDAPVTISAITPSPRFASIINTDSSM